MATHTIGTPFRHGFGYGQVGVVSATGAAVRITMADVHAQLTTAHTLTEIDLTTDQRTCLTCAEAATSPTTSRQTRLCQLRKLSECVRQSVESKLREMQV